jgi:thiol-disulfide isomerase/thioredoxin
MRLFIVCVVGVILGLVAWSLSEEQSGPLPEVKVKACKLAGVEEAIAEAKGKVVLIDCWSITCGPCVSSFPALVAKHKKYAEKGLVIIALNLDKDEDTADVEKFLKKARATFTNLRLILEPETGQQLIHLLDVGEGIPHAALFNKRGERVWAGHPMSNKLPDMIEAELAR